MSFLSVYSMGKIMKKFSDLYFSSYHQKLGRFFQKNDTKMTITRKMKIWNDASVSLHSYRERIVIIPSSFCPCRKVTPAQCSMLSAHHCSWYLMSSASHIADRKKSTIWESPRLTSEFLFGLRFPDLPPLPSMNHLHLTDMRVINHFNDQHRELIIRLSKILSNINLKLG